MELTDYAMVVSFANAKACKVVARAIKVPTGAIRVFNAVIFRTSQGKYTTPGQIYAQKVAPQTLTRSYISLLVNRGLLERRWLGAVVLKPTLSGHQAAALFQRQLRETCRSFERA
jgi:hypothetical protein